MPPSSSPEAYTQQVWTAVRALWPNLGEDPAGTVQPYVPVLPTFLAEAHREGRTPESAALEVLRFFLDLYVRNAMSEADRKANLTDLHSLSKRTYDESQQVGVLPFTAALVGAHQVVQEWTGAGKLAEGSGLALNRDVLCALVGKTTGEISRLGWLTIEAARRS
jgi:hypothetical protein